MNEQNVEKIVNDLMSLAEKDNVKDFIIANVVFQLSFIEKLMSVNALQREQEREFIRSIYNKLNQHIHTLLNDESISDEHSRHH